MARHSMDILELLRKRGMDGDVDFLREALAVLVDGIMDGEASVKAGAGYGERSPDRVTQRNGYRSRSWWSTTVILAGPVASSEYDAPIFVKRRFRLAGRASG